MIITSGTSFGACDIMYQPDWTQMAPMYMWLDASRSEIHSTLSSGYTCLKNLIDFSGNGRGFSDLSLGTMFQHTINGVQCGGLIKPNEWQSRNPSTFANGTSTGINLNYFAIPANSEYTMITVANVKQHLNYSTSLTPVLGYFEEVNSNTLDHEAPCVSPSSNSSLSQLVVTHSGGPSSNVVISNYSHSSGSPHLFTTTRDTSGIYTMRMQKVDAGDPANDNTSYSRSEIWINRLMGSRAGISPFTANSKPLVILGEVLLFSTKLTASQIEQVENHLWKKWKF